MTRREINALRRENELLKKRLAEIEKRQNGKASPPPLHFHDRRSYAQLISGSKSYTVYLLRSLRASDIYKRIRKILLWMSRFRILSTAMRILSYAAAVIEAGTHIVIISTLILFLLPISALLATATLLLSLIGQKRANDFLRTSVSGKDVYVFFPESRSQFTDEHFLGRWIGSLASSGKCTVFIVSPSFWSRAGLCRGKYYLHYRQDTDNVIMLRKYYYFSFKRNVLNSKKAKSATLIF